MGKILQGNINTENVLEMVNGSEYKLKLKDITILHMKQKLAIWRIS